MTTRVASGLKDFNFMLNEAAAKARLFANMLVGEAAAIAWLVA
jgi:hypothetical protein